MDNTIGKIEEEFLEAFITSRCGEKRPEVLVKPGFGLDVSLVALPGNRVMALTSDPLSLIPSLGLQESAWLSVQLMANDMATTGFAPQYGQFVLNLPAEFSQEDFKTYWEHIHTFCQKMGMAITGGHTGFVAGQNSTIAGGGTFISILPADQALTADKAQAGEVLLVTKTAAISSSAILAMSFPETTKNRVGRELYQKACAAFYETSSLRDGLVAKGTTNDITAMHDVTEGGLLGAIYELATAAGCGVHLDKNKLPVGPAQAAVCEVFDLDPLQCIGAGSMIIACKKEKAALVENRLLSAGIACSLVGELTDASHGMVLHENDQRKALVYQKKDPYWEAFFQASKQGWK
ncbi:AIR synthase family protein [Cyclobacterium jeungdonense]|uniref:AIR synthase family protein n=1 Tax=Cyclobacterium jeungdonense TaxID=708087 RepID=A0ABT8C3L4_9BACT|nr:AIR synthase family protein [Cyclobacterium jeungdonense]MDN3686218.1 AIR synthase family protein [Cyclobacterium jeungdonense]